MPRLRHLIALIVAPLLFTACAHRPDAPAASGNDASSVTTSHLSADEVAAIRAEALRAFRASDHASLETLASRLRADLPRTPDGGYALEYFYDSFAPKNLGLALSESIARFADWERSPTGPASPTRAAAAALYWRHQNSSPDPHLHDEAAVQAKSRSASLGKNVPDSACPHLAIERHLRLSSSEANRARVTAIYSAAITAFPGYPPLIETYANWLLGFAEPEVGPWLAAECDKLDAPERDETYAVVAISRPRSSYDWIDKRRLDWPRIQRGIESSHRRWPDAPGTLDKLAQAAESHQDRAVLRQTLLRIEASPHRPTWSDNLGSYLRTRRVAGLESRPDLRPARELDLEMRGYRVAVSPDSRIVVAGCTKGDILAFSAPDLVPLWHLKCPRWVSSLAFSPDGRLLCATSGNGGSVGGVWVWEIASGKLLTYDDSLPQRLVASAFSPDGRTLWAAGGVGKKSFVLRWSPGDTAFTRVTLPVGLGAIKSAAAANDACYFSASKKIWRFPADSIAAPVVIHEGEAINAIALAPDGRDLVLGDWRANTEWDKPARLRRLDLFPVASSSAPVVPSALDSNSALQGTRIEAVSFSRAGLLAAASSGGDFAVWRADSRRRPWLSGHVDDAWTIDDLALSPDGNLIATVDTSGQLRLWNLPASLRCATGPLWPVK